MDTLVPQLVDAAQRAAEALGLGSALPLFIFAVLAFSLLIVGLYYVSTTNARAERRTALLLGDIDAVTARLNEGERLGKFGTFALNFQHPEMSFLSEHLYVLCGLIKRKHLPSTETLLEHVVEEDKKKAREGWADAQKKPGPYSFLYRVRGLGGELRFVRVEGIATLDDAMRPYTTAGVIRDVSKELEVDKAKSEFVSLASHQLKTPLTTVRWHCEALLKNVVGALTPEQLAYVRTISEANQRMITLVNELLNVSRIELKTFSEKTEEIDVRALVESVVEEQRQSSEARKQVLHVVVGEVPHIVADKTMVRMVFQNLLSNAIKYTPDKGVVTCEVGVGGASKEGIFLKVTDTGIGIPQKEQNRVFEKLHRASNARVLVSDGTGLGLYVVKMILEHAGGAITFDSVEGKGTTFYVTLPLDWAASQTTGGAGR